MGLQKPRLRCRRRRRSRIVVALALLLAASERRFSIGNPGTNRCKFYSSRASRGDRNGGCSLKGIWVARPLWFSEVRFPVPFWDDLHSQNGTAPHFAYWRYFTFPLSHVVILRHQSSPLPQAGAPRNCCNTASSSPLESALTKLGSVIFLESALTEKGGHTQTFLVSVPTVRVPFPEWAVFLAPFVASVWLTHGRYSRSRTSPRPTSWSLIQTRYL